jgi:hypothetical protein
MILVKKMVDKYSHRKAMYLKVNRCEEYAIKNLSRWIDAAYLIDADCYIICDNEELESKIREKILFYTDVIFLKSINSEQLDYIVNNIANRNWINAAYAHLTTFLHARDKCWGFWNIDAGDTINCLSIY